MDAGTLIMSGLTSESVLDAVRVVLDQHRPDAPAVQSVADYDGGPVSKKVLRVVLSYIDYVNRTVWGRSV
jgi:UDP-N-acetylglucosamine 2-epimerase (non-hydrolysing)